MCTPSRPVARSISKTLHFVLAGLRSGLESVGRPSPSHGELPSSSSHSIMARAFSNRGTGIDSAIPIVFSKPRLFEDLFLLRLLQPYNSKSSDPPPPSPEAPNVPSVAGVWIRGKVQCGLGPHLRPRGPTPLRPVVQPKRIALAVNGRWPRSRLCGNSSLTSSVIQIRGSSSDRLV
jgi:hypothetical protein